MLAASTLHFADPPSFGPAPVIAMDGSPVAFIRRPLAGPRFTADNPDGSPLCRVRRRFLVSGNLDLLYGDGRKFGFMKYRMWSGANVDCEGRRLRLSSRWFGQGWVLVDEAGTEVLWSIRSAATDRTHEQLETGRLPDGSPTVFGMPYQQEWFITVGEDDWLVTTDNSLALAHVVAIVESYRMDVKGRRKLRRR